MSWAALTDDDVLKEFTPQEQNSINAIQGATTSLTAILSEAAAAARDYIAAGDHEVDETAGTVPAMLRPDVIAIARWRWLISMPSLKALQTPERKAAYERGEERLDKIAAGELKVPGSTAGENPSSGTWNSENRLDMRTTPTVRPRTRESTESANPAND
jgi:hypothetical protein